MRRSNYLFSAIQLALLVVFSAAVAQAQAIAPLSSNISFTVAMPRPYTHLFEVELRVKIPANLQVPNESDLVMPVWTPGSYLIRAQSDKYISKERSETVTLAQGQTLTLNLVFDTGIR